MPRRNVIAALLFGIGLFALGLSGIEAKSGEGGTWLEKYNDAMQAPEHP